MSDPVEILAPEATLRLTAESSTISGRVLADGKPLADVPVSLGGQIDQTYSNFTGKTDKDGNFEFSDLPHAYSSLFVWVGAPGFASETVQSIRLEKSEKKVLKPFELVPADGTISGKVIDEKGNPVPNVEVSAQQDTVGSSANTDENGRFFLKQVKRGSFFMIARKGDDFGSLDAKTGQTDVTVILKHTEVKPTAYVSVDVSGMEAKELDLDSWYQGDPVKVKELRGKYVVLDFFNVGCAPCLASMPDIQKFQDDYADKLVLIGVCDMSEAKLKLPKIIKAKNVHYRMAYDKADKLGLPVTHQLYGFKGNPNLVLIDPKGKVVMSSSDIEDIRFKLKELLAGAE